MSLKGKVTEKERDRNQDLLSVDSCQALEGPRLAIVWDAGVRSGLPDCTTALTPVVTMRVHLEQELKALSRCGAMEAL